MKAKLTLQQRSVLEEIHYGAASTRTLGRSEQRTFASLVRRGLVEHVKPATFHVCGKLTVTVTVTAAGRQAIGE